MQHLRFRGGGNIQEGIGCEHLEFEREVWARGRTESYMRVELYTSRQPQRLRAQTLVSNCWGSTPLNSNVTLSKLLNISEFSCLSDVDNIPPQWVLNED